MNAPPHNPIGYYLNRTDEAITAAMNAVLAEFSLTRTDWQVLNVIHNADQIPRTEVYEIMRPLADSAALFTVLASLIKSDWVALVGPDRLALTDLGRKRLGVVREQIAAFREKSMRGISPEEYQTVIRVLERMRMNLENQNPES
ncbi:MAG: MarR family transcriptional regulator [Sphingobacteriaceae bacterium]|nr:MarR family transcriptional regulator [Cytophagaceae bacterium]